MLLDLLRIIKPTLNIVDAVMAMDGEGGPTTGNLRNLGLLVFGTDAVAVDATCALLTGKQPQDFSFLRLAAENKVGEPDPTKIDIVGARLENSICHDFKHIEISREQMLPGWIPAFIVNYARKLLLDRPVLQRENCKKCGACSTICAAKAIKPVNGYPTFNYAKCIRCFCCQEMCKYKALKIKRSFLARILLRS
jgi:ferredoxin